MVSSFRSRKVMLGKHKRIMSLNPTFLNPLTAFPTVAGCSEVSGAQTLTSICAYDSLSWISYDKVVSGWQNSLPLVAPFE
ncbi:hypothetical protein TNCV_3773351 [Trichonephila clavipes]|nr:hypothetical protein TNCV_3773351 [Trichonephila clavipes]